MLKIDFRLPTEGDDELPWYDHSTTVAIHTCPRYGIIRCLQGMAVPAQTETRSLPLELGHAVHQATAVNRLYHCFHQGQCVDGVSTVLLRLFGRDRGTHLLGYMEKSRDEAVLEALYTSEYYDDPSDKRRTIANAETSLLYYLQSYDLHEYPPLIIDGIPQVEVPIHFVVSFSQSQEGEDKLTSCGSIRYVGRADGIHTYNNNTEIHDDKTGSNVANNWNLQWMTSHQLTGYMIGAALRYNRPVNHGRVLGVQIPLPTTYGRGFVDQPVDKCPRQFMEWGRWLYEAVDIVDKFKAQPWDAPLYTHSCYRFFRPCSFLPICSSDEDDFKLAKQELVYDKWNPLTDMDTQ